MDRVLDVWVSALLVASTLAAPGHSWILPKSKFLLFSDGLSLGASRPIRAAPSPRTFTAVSGQRSLLKCPLAAYGLKDLRWEKGFERLPVNHRQRLAPDFTLAIDNVQKEADSGEYVCIGLDAKGREKSHTVQLRILEPPTISLGDFQLDIQQGMRMRALCSVLRGDAPFQFSWLKDGLPLETEAGLTAQSHRDFSILSSASVRLEHGGNYTCAVRNEVGAVAASSVLKVNAPPTWTVEPQNSEVIRGGSVRLDCQAIGSPPPVVSWKRAPQGRDLGDYSPVFNSHKHTVYGNGSFGIQSAEKSESGSYLCQASNGFGAGLSKLVHVAVHEPPTFEVKFRAQAVKRGQRAELECHVAGDPPMTLTWGREGQPLGNSSHYSVSPARTNGSAVLNLHSARVEDSGVYICKATNSYGEDETRIQLLVQEPPGPPGNVTVSNVTGHSVTAVWSEPYRGNSAITLYTVQVAPTGGEKPDEGGNITTTAAQPPALVSGLRPASRYRVRVRAENSVGTGPFSPWTAFLTDHEAPGGPPTNISARATGPNSIKVSWSPPPKSQWHGGLTGFYVGYHPESSSGEAPLYKTVEWSEQGPLEAHLTNLRRSTAYRVAVQAFNGKGAGPASEEVAVRTLEDVPPSAPSLEVTSSTTSSITVTWTQKTAFGNTVKEYVLHYRRENEAWRQTAVPGNLSGYTLADLDCGRGYQLYVTAHNSVGKSEPSELLNARTDGAAPLSPGQAEFIRAGPRNASLHLSAWRSGGCGVAGFAVRVRTAGGAWRPVAVPAQHNGSLMLTGLGPASWVDLHVTARSPAGDTEATYHFQTLNTSATPLRGSEVRGARNTEPTPRPRGSSLADLEILVPVAVSAAVVCVVVAVGCVLCARELRCFSTTQPGTNRHLDRKQSRDIVMKELSGEQGLEEGSRAGYHTSIYSPREIGTTKVLKYIIDEPYARPIL